MPTKGKAKPRDRRTVVAATRITQEMYDRLSAKAKENYRSVAAEMLYAIDAHIRGWNSNRMQK